MKKKFIVVSIEHLTRYTDCANPPRTSEQIEHDGIQWVVGEPVELECTDIGRPYTTRNIFGKDVKICFRPMMDGVHYIVETIPNSDNTTDITIKSD